MAPYTPSQRVVYAETAKGMTQAEKVAYVMAQVRLAGANDAIEQLAEVEAPPERPSKTVASARKPWYAGMRSVKAGY